MPKQVVPPIPNKNKDFSSFTNSAGEHFVIRGLSPLLPQKIMDAVRVEFANAGKTLPVIPTYEVTTISGEKEIHEHDAKSLVVSGNPEQTKLNEKVWGEYVSQSSELDKEYNVRLMRAVFMVVEAKPSQEWREEMAFLGVPTPAENSPAEKYDYIETHVIQSAIDLSRLMTSVFRLAGVISEAAIADVDATFQRDMERAFTEAGKPSDKK